MEINIDRINKLFGDLYDVFGVGDINYHRIIDGGLVPTHIMETDLMGVDRWKRTHSALKVKVKGDPVLERIIKGEIVFIYDVVNDKKSSPAFSNFGIKSLVVFPLFNADKSSVNGLICIPSLDKKFEFSEEGIRTSEILIKKFNNDIN